MASKKFKRKEMVYISGVIIVLAVILTFLFFQNIDDTNPNIHSGAVVDISGNLIDEDGDGFDQVCITRLSEVIISKNITYVKKDVENEISRNGQVRIIIKLTDISKRSDVLRNISLIREVKNFISVVVSEDDLINLLDRFTEDDIELIQVDHPIRLVLDDVVNQTGVDMVWVSNVTGKGQTTCVIDSGIDYNHSNLLDNYIGGYDFISNDDDPMDDYGHGTYVSGIVTGIAPDSKILAVKVFGGDGIGYESDILAGIDYCVRNKDLYNISVMLMSFGGGIYNTSCYCDSNLVANESNFAVSQGIFAVAASGNDGKPFLKAPACGTNVTSVGAVDKSDNVADFTNIEPLLDLLAPGVGVTSTKIGGGFETKNGTSVSAAVVAGGASLILENENLNPFDLQYMLRSTGFLIAHQGTNYPRFDAYAALINQITNTPSVQQGTQCEGTWEEYEPLAVTCTTASCPCGGKCQTSACSGGLAPDCLACCDVQCDCTCVQGLCGAECDTGTNCQLYCATATNRHTSCDTVCASCQCTGSYSCSLECASGCARHNACTGGSGCTGSTDCGSYTCSVGTGCTTTCEKDCGANCESAADCPDYCAAGNVKTTGRNCNSACNCAGGSTYDCDNLDGYYCINSDFLRGYNFKCATSGECSSGAGNPKCVGDYDGASQTCSNSNTCTGTCGTGVDSCKYREYYCSGSSGCWGVSGGNDCCDGSSPGANCNSYNDQNCDTSSARCTGCSQHWAVGGSGDCTGEQCLTNCCGDDSVEKYRYCQAGTGFPDAGTCTSADDTCCDVATDCVDVNGGSCITSGTHATDGDGDGDHDYCLSGIWYDCYNDGDCSVEHSCVSNNCVDNTISGGHGTTCDVSNPCLYIKDSVGTVKARFDDNGNIDVKGSYSNGQGTLTPPANSFIIRDSGAIVRLYIDNVGNMKTRGYFYKQASPSPGGSNDFQVKDSVGTVVGFIDGPTGSMYFKGQLHYSSDF